MILGPSGSGKSTLLRAINPFDRLDAGYVSVGGELIGIRRLRGCLKDILPQKILRQRRKIGFAFPSFHLAVPIPVLKLANPRCGQTGSVVNPGVSLWARTPDGAATETTIALPQIDSIRNTLPPKARDSGQRVIGIGALPSGYPPLAFVSTDQPSPPISAR